MTRLSGIRLLILGTVLWALAVWIFDAPPPTETPAATETAAAPAPTGATAGAGASGSTGIETTAASVPPAAADRPPATSPNPDAAAGSPSLRTGSAGITGAAPAPASAATGDGTRIAMAPASGDSVPSGPAAPTTTPTGATASDAAGTGAGPAPGAPIPPRAPETGGTRTSADDSGIPPPPDPWIEHPLPPPARPGSAAVDDNAVVDAINVARRAAWEGRLVDALAHYRAAARIQPDLHVVWGEMGNVLWAMRRWPEAAYALEGAATLLVRAGELRAASELVPAVARIDPEAAYRVQRLLWVTAQRQSG